ncbi:hypothetical protein HWV00_06705 [Moritella sp. 24]|uniref:hypothetical protein n=1 Tax=Moritella sp. 24 TaxID=2746230 RepID=UPI001BA9A1BC|nr:hypothetical protein [Moritella sp. 24]QUM75938.1 hypothetical protein HWV00_06705 [Moritella sp. 24]
MKYVSALLTGFVIVFVQYLILVSMKLDFFFYLVGTSTLDSNSHAYWILALHDLIIIGSTSLLGIACYKAIFKTSPFNFKASLVMQVPLFMAALALNGLPTRFVTTYQIQTAVVTFIACFAIVLIFNLYRETLRCRSYSR